MRKATLAIVLCVSFGCATEPERTHKWVPLDWAKYPFEQADAECDAWARAVTRPSDSLASNHFSCMRAKGWDYR